MKMNSTRPSYLTWVSHYSLHFMLLFLLRPDIDPAHKFLSVHSFTSTACQTRSQAKPSRDVQTSTKRTFSLSTKKHASESSGIHSNTLSVMRLYWFTRNMLIVSAAINTLKSTCEQEEQRKM